MNFRKETLSWLQKNSFRFIGQRFKISSPTLNRYVLSVSDCWLIDWNKIEVTKLGIDEHSFRGNNLVITITDISHRKLLAILKTDRQRALIEFLNSIPKKAKIGIKEVCIDLVADRYHVETLAKRMVDDIRVVVQGEYEHYPVLKQAWLIKEKIVRFYQLGNYERAQKKFKYITLTNFSIMVSCTY